MRNLVKAPLQLVTFPGFLELPSRKRLPHIAGAATVALACIYALSPYLALWSLSTALRTHDAQALARHIDWSALSSSLKAETIDALVGPPPAEDDLPDFGTSFASNAVSHAIDTRLTPELLMTMTSQIMKASPGNASLLQTSHLKELYTRLSAHFISPTRFEAGLATRPGQRPTIVHMKFEHWHWKIIQFELPRAV